MSPGLHGAGRFVSVISCYGRTRRTWLLPLGIILRQPRWETLRLEGRLGPPLRPDRQGWLKGRSHPGQVTAPRSADRQRLEAGGQQTMAAATSTPAGRSSRTAPSTVGYSAFAQAAPQRIRDRPQQVVEQ